MRIRRFGLNCYDERRSREGAKHTSCSSTAPPRRLRERVRTLLPIELSVLEQLSAPQSAPFPEALRKGSPFPRSPCSRNSLLGCARFARQNGRHQPPRLFAGQLAHARRAILRHPGHLVCQEPDCGVGQHPAPLPEEMCWRRGPIADQGKLAARQVDGEGRSLA